MKASSELREVRKLVPSRDPAAQDEWWRTFSPVFLFLLGGDMRWTGLRPFCLLAHLLSASLQTNFARDRVIRKHRISWTRNSYEFIERHAWGQRETFFGDIHKNGVLSLWHVTAPTSLWWIEIKAIKMEVKLLNTSLFYFELPDRFQCFWLWEWNITS